MQLRILTNVEGLKPDQGFELQIRETEAEAQVYGTKMHEGYNSQHT